MRFQIIEIASDGASRRHVVIDRGSGEFTSFPATVGNPVYDSFLESQSLTDIEVQAMTPDIWHDMA